MKHILYVSIEKYTVMKIKDVKLVSLPEDVEGIFKGASDWVGLVRLLMVSPVLFRESASHKLSD